MIEKALKRAGYSADSCFDGEEALSYLLGAEYDAILLDVMLTKLDGYSLLKLLRERDVDAPVNAPPQHKGIKGIDVEAC